jgi:hypothetical protein
MPNIIQQVERYPLAGSDWAYTQQTILRTARNVTATKVWGIKKGTFSFELDKGNKFFDGVDNLRTPELDFRDLIRISFKKTPGTSTYTFVNDDMIMEGIIDDVNQEVSPDSGNIVKVTGYDWAEVFFNIELPVFFSQKNFMEMLREIITIRLAQDFTIKIEWDSANPTVKIDGTTSFPLKNLGLNYTPVYTMLDQITGDDYTGDGKYFWYISRGTNGVRTFSVRPQSSTIGGSTTISETLPIEKLSIARNKDAIRNFIIYNCGTDLYGVSVEDYYADAASIGRNGWGTYYMINETGGIFASLLSTEQTTQRSRYTTDGNGNFTSNFPTSYGSPYTFTFNSATSVSSNSDFNQQLRLEALRQGLARATAYVQTSNRGFYSITATFPYTTNFTLGVKYNFALDYIRKFVGPLRLKEIQYTLTNVTGTFDQDIIDRLL